MVVFLATLLDPINLGNRKFYPESPDRKVWFFEIKDNPREPAPVHGCKVNGFAITDKML